MTNLLIRCCKLIVVLKYMHKRVIYVFFLPRNAMLVVYAIVVCLSVGHKSVIY